ncbi:hypothetical protein E0485_16905 [Paenibacillus albiflavus]|uniref:DUF2157 domain-containing protein n=1 Tax=Paenibacillus albiflavus TaxID=2545760 RepID=A0A4R4E9I5_9BACL|nr:hypothetical protein [Paenibacillus albiflavus]TCZ75570.1 hypothetical protein E0485_16905 [Paenibacillus albiflavus]
MDEDKRRIIVAEIMQWRRSKLLPEQYCDFLMNLYRLEQSEEKDESKHKYKSILPMKSSNWKAWLLTAIITALLAVVIYSFTMQNLIMQVAVSVVFVVFCYVVGILLRHRTPIISNGLSGLASLSLLVAGIFILRSTEGTLSEHYIIYIAACALIWFIIGLAGRMRVLQACGLIALLFTYCWLLHNQFGVMNWLNLQLSFVPLALVFIWIGSLIHYRNKQIASVLLLVGIGTWLVPELFGLFIPEASDQFIMQISLIGKLVIGSIIIILSRKNWMKWVGISDD